VDEQEIKVRYIMLLDKDEKRIARIFNIDNNEKLPAVKQKTLNIYYRYLSNNLAFPFQAEYSQETGPFENIDYDIVVTKVLEVEESADPEFYGLFCEAKQGNRKIVIPLAEVEIKGKTKNRQLVDNYNSWFWNYR
jgi:hypothetical protein